MLMNTSITNSYYFYEVPFLVDPSTFFEFFRKKSMQFFRKKNYAIFNFQKMSAL